jgi:fengycin family lipopeptide synthetase D
MPIGIPGELIVGGVGVARGYLNNPLLTAEKFISLPLSLSGPLYLTGDLAKWLPDGTIEFLGRIDTQIKIRGQRIELEEIENKLLYFPCIEETVITVNEDVEGNKYLCAYFVANDAVTESELIDYLGKDLPGYMIPAYFVQVEYMPLTSNGKIDRRALPQPTIKIKKEYVPPKNEAEEKLVEIWSEVLKKEKDIISITANFFQLGGNSLKITTIAAKIYKEFGVEISLADIFNKPTIKDIAAFIKIIERARKKDSSPHQEREEFTL